MLGEIDPAGIGGEIDGAPFFVAVAEIAHAAEEIGEMGDGDQGIAGGSERGGVVPFNDVANSLGQSPGFGEDDATLAVREAERFLFLFVERAAGFDGFGDNFAILVGEGERIDDDAEIVKEGL